MQRELSTEDRHFQLWLREFFTTEIPQHVRDHVSRGDPITPEVMRASQQTMNEAGIAVPGWPTEWGGKDWTPLQHHLWHAEMQDAQVLPPLNFNASMIGPVIAQFGSEEMKQRFLPQTASLDIWWCQGFSEPDAGSDLASLRTTAVRDGDDWIVNGQKTWTTLGQYADWIFCLVRTDPDVKKQAGISMLLIPMDAPGVELRPIRLLDGGYEVNEVFFTDVRVPGDQLVGEENRGWDYAKFLLGNERVGVAPVGAIKRRLAQIKQHAGEVAAGDGTLLDDPLTAARIARLEADVMALELTVLRVAGNSRDGKPDPASSILKLRGTELQQQVHELGVEVAGPMAAAWSAADGFDPSLPAWTARVMPTYLNFRKATIYGGSSEVQRQVISTGILGLR